MNKEYLETIKILDGEIYNLKYHQKRYESVLNSLNIQETRILEEYIKPPKKGLYKCRIVYTSNNDISVSYHPYHKKLVYSLKLITNNEIEYEYKYLNREKIDRLFSQKDNCDDILIIKNSFITDTSIANIAFYKDGVWKTPKYPLLNGTTRQRLLDEGRIIEEEIREIDIPSFSKIALMNSMIDFDILESYEISL